MKQVVIATKNMGKVREFAELFERFDLEVKSLHDFPHIEEVEETGETFEENAILKADSLCKQLNSIVIADDSGLIVDALHGKPGVRSARYAGEPKDDQANIDKVLSELEGVSLEKRTARFYCALAVAFPEDDKEPVIVNGTCEGKILEQRRGHNGFGYDPIFYVEEYKKAMAELNSDEKNTISHRGRALRKLEEKIPEWFLEEWSKGERLMKALIVSDSHGSVKELQQLKEMYEGKVDVMIHCGDSELTSEHQDIQGFQIVKGNCDFHNDFENEIVMDVKGVRFLIVHGHRHNVKMTLQTLAYYAEEVAANVICFGHSHVLGAEIYKDMLFINPGSILLPRTRKEKTFALLQINEQEIEVQFKTLEGQVVEQVTFQRG